ncbi:MAG: PP0621 family protein [Burkholderiaceae bacterium]|nr:PP0621 family protein [Burkholderiaceae bacterium]
MKLLIWLAFFGLVVAALVVRKSPSRIKTAEPPRRREFDSTGAELMVRCAHCGVYVPVSEAVKDRGAEYCCEEHRGKPSSC